MNNIDKRALREAAANAKVAGEAPVMPFDQRITALNDFMKHCTPDVLLALLNELEAQEVKLPQRFDVKTHSCSEEPDGEWYARDDVLAALATAGVRACEEG